MHMTVSEQELTDLLMATWKAAQESPYALKDQTIEELLISFQKKQEKPWVILKAEEWSKLSGGTRIFHSLFGAGVVGSKNGEKHVAFRGFKMEFIESGWPWDQTVQLL
jgi:hypothetical protein